MDNRKLQKRAEDVANNSTEIDEVINNLITEIEEKESEIEDLIEELRNSKDEIEELESQLKNI